MVQQMANPIRVAQKMELIVSTLPKMPPASSLRRLTARNASSCFRRKAAS